MGLRFQAGGGVPFFQIPAEELRDRIISLDELWNCRAEELRENLLKAPTLKTRFLVLERFLLSMMVQPPEQHPVVDFALREGRKITHAHG